MAPHGSRSGRTGARAATAWNFLFAAILAEPAEDCTARRRVPGLKRYPLWQLGHCLASKFSGRTRNMLLH
jgi:hypothetical protein